MGRYVYVLFSLAAFSVGFLGWANAQPTTRKTLDERIADTIDVLRHQSNAYTNSRKSNFDIIAALKAATPTSLTKPTLVSSKYSSVPNENGTKSVMLRWIEDKPTLKEVIIVNPDTRKEQRIEIPERDFKSQEEWGNILYTSMIEISPEVAPDATQVLDVMTVDREQQASLYPSDRRKDSPVITPKNSGK